MNYYERHLGDYARDTGHLSMMEHGAYTLLLDRYYASEKGIAADQAHRLARARSADERAAVDAVLVEFFELVDGFWIQGRVEAEIEKAAGRINAARENGKKGGRPRRQETQKEPTGFPLGSENETQHEPSEKLTNHQTPPKSERDALASTVTGDAGRAMRAAGCSTMNLANPDFLAAIDEGVTAAEFGAAANEAADRQISPGARFAYAVKVARSNHAKVAEQIERPNPRAGPPAARAGKVMGLLQTLEGMKDGLDQSGISDGLPDAGYARLGRAAGG